MKLRQFIRRYILRIPPREWLVIEKSWQRSLFFDGDPIMGYIPRDVVEGELGIKIEDGRCKWFTREDGERMRAHPEWRTTLP